VFCLQLLLVQISETAGFGRTFNDCEVLSDVEPDLSDVFAIQFYNTDTQQLGSSSPADQVSIVAINAVPDRSSDNMTA